MVRRTFNVLREFTARGLDNVAFIGSNLHNNEETIPSPRVVWSKIKGKNFKSFSIIFSLARLYVYT